MGKQYVNRQHSPKKVPQTLLFFSAAVRLFVLNCLLRSQFALEFSQYGVFDTVKFALLFVLF